MLDKMSNMFGWITSGEADVIEKALKILVTYNFSDNTIKEIIKGIKDYEEYFEKNY